MYLDKKIAFLNSGETSEVLDLTASGVSSIIDFKTAGYFDGGAKQIYLNIDWTEALASTGSVPISLVSADVLAMTTGKQVDLVIDSPTTTAGTPRPVGFTQKIAMPFKMREFVRLEWTATTVTGGKIKAFLSGS